MKNTGIEWAHHTFNPWWGCQRVSPGCENCYAEAFDHRLGGEHWGPGSPRKLQSDRYWLAPLDWDRAAQLAGRRDRVFCASMADVFEDQPELDRLRRKLFDLIRATPHLDWLLLTKRPESFVAMLPWRPADDGPLRWGAPWPNVWLGVTAENQQWADRRIPVLLRTPAVKRFVSYEPALGPVSFDLPSCPNGCQEQLGRDTVLWADDVESCRHCGEELGLAGWLGSIDWVIAGAESGPGRRPMDEQWIRDVRDECAHAGTAFFYKQRVDGEGRGTKVSLPMLDSQRWAEVPA